jgi:hypothetical protein
MNAIRKSWTAFQVATVLILTIGTAGWVVPAYLALSFYMTGVEYELAGTADQSSFPFMSESQRLLKLAAVWLFAVLFVWGFLGARRLLLPTRNEKAT